MAKNRFIFSEKEGDDWVSVDSTETVDALKKQLQIVTDEKDALTETVLKYVNEQDKLLHELYAEREKNLQYEQEIKDQHQLKLRISALIKELDAEKSITTELQVKAKISTARHQATIENLIIESENNRKESSKRNQNLSDALKMIKKLQEEALLEKQKNIYSKTYTEAQKNSLAAPQSFLHSPKSSGRF